VVGATGQIWLFQLLRPINPEIVRTYNARGLVKRALRPFFSCKMLWRTDLGRQGRLEQKNRGGLIWERK